jgi:hypothetical protein
MAEKKGSKKTALEVEKEFGKYWTRKYYVLVKADNFFGYTIQDEEAGSFVIIEKDEMVPIVIERMIKNGCRIYNSSADLPQRILKQWTSTEEWLNFSKIAKEFNLEHDDVDEVARQVAGNKLDRQEIIEIIKKYKELK